MRNVLIALSLLFPLSAEAQVVNLLTCTLQSSLTYLSPGATCTYGGLRFTCQTITTTTNTDYCFPGNTGPTGATGATGNDGLSVVGSSESPGSNCTYGGVAYSIGMDDPTYVCNGAPGTNGSTGATGPQGPAGESAITGHYVDINNDEVEGVINIAGNAYIWSDGTYFKVNTTTGLVECENQIGEFTGLSCNNSGGILAANYLPVKTARCRSYPSNNTWYITSDNISIPTHCSRYEGSCTGYGASNCWSGSEYIVELETFSGDVPNLTGYDAPFVFVQE